MVSIIVAFSNKDNAAKIRNLIVRSGMDVTGVCTAGAQVLQYADMADEGIVVCGYKLKDMMYTGLREYLPGQWAFPGRECRYFELEAAGVECLAFGLGAVSCLEGVRSWNTGDLEMYLGHSAEPGRIICRTETVER